MSPSSFTLRMCVCSECRQMHTHLSQDYGWQDLYAEDRQSSVDSLHLCCPFMGGLVLVLCQSKCKHLWSAVVFSAYSCASWQPSRLVASLAHTYTNFLPLWWLLLWDHCGLIPDPPSTEYWGIVLISLSTPEWNWSYQGPFSVSWDVFYYYYTIYYFIDILIYNNKI